jgi:ribulose-bisphosphate carboxylase large chain
MARNDQCSSCETPLTTRGKTGSRNRYYPFQDNFTWKGVKVQNYKSKGSDWSGIVRQVLIGACGESTKFHLRYFEIKQGGYSSFETHKHEHVVIGVRGKGKARLNRRNIYINFLDVLYINPNTPHRFYNPYSEPFGFFCIVNANRDRPKPVKD